MHPHLHRAETALTDCAARLTLEQLVRHPDGKWSPADILEHLGLAFPAGRRNAARLDRTLTPPGASQSRPPLPHVPRRRLRLLAERANISKGSRAVGNNPAEVLASALASLRRLDGVLDAVAQGFGVRTKVLKHHVLGPMSVADWRKISLGPHPASCPQIAERANVSR